MCEGNFPRVDHVRPRDSNDKFFTNTSYITRKSFLRFIKGHPREEYNPPWPKPRRFAYPKCNIYYAFNEDTNPFTRGDSTFDWRDHVDVEPCFQRPTEPYVIRDPYSETEARRKYLETKPTCFVIFGKPDLDTVKLASTIADAWKCVLISPLPLIEREIERSTEKGKTIEKILRRGQCLGPEIIMNLIEARISARDVSHRGYIVDGLPLIPNSTNLDYSCYPSYTIDDSRTTISRKNSSLPDVCTGSSEIGTDRKILSSNTRSDIDETATSTEASDYEIFKSGTCKVRINYEHDIPTQINNIFSSWPVKPLVIIYAACSKEDAITKRNHFRLDPLNGRTVDTSLERSNGDVETLFSHDKIENEMNISFDVYQELMNEEGILDRDRRKYLLKRICDMRSNVEAQCSLYERLALPVIEKWVLLHNPQYVIRVDRRTSASRMFQIISARLRVLPLPRLIIPKWFRDRTDAEFQGESPTMPAAMDELENKTNEEAFRDLADRETVSPRFPWRLSSLRFLCPVELARGKTVEGASKYTVRFMNKIFFLSSMEALNLFIENPRTFLSPPNPRPVCRIAVFGPKYSGKSTLCKDLSRIFGGTVIDVDELERSVVEDRINSRVTDTMREILSDVITELQKNLEAERTTRESNRLAELGLWHDEICATIDRFLHSLESASENSEEDREIYEELESLRETLRFHNLQDVENDRPLRERLTADKTSLYDYAPDHLRMEEPPVRELTEHDPKVVAVLEDRTRHIYDEPIHLSINEKANIIIENIRQVPRQRIEEEIWRDGDYIVDGMYVDIEVWQEVVENSNITFEDVIFLHEENPYDRLISNWRKIHENEEDRNEIEFEEVGGEHAGWRGEVKKELAEYIQHIKQFELDWEILKEKVTNSTKNFVDCNLGNVEHVLEHIVERIWDRYRDKAAIMTIEDKDREAELEKYADLIDDTGNIDTIEEEDEEETERRVEDKRRLGDTNYYCPVALSGHNVLWRGKEEFSALFMDKIYLLSSAKALEEFVRDPRKFSIPFIKPPSVIPPLRISIVGPLGSGKSTLANSISREYGLTHIDFFHCLTMFMGNRCMPLLHPTDVFISPEDLLNEVELPEDLEDHRYNSDRETVQTAIRRYWANGGVLPPIMRKECLLKLFQFPYSQHGLVFDSFPSCPEDIRAATENYAVPELIIELRCGFEESMNRAMPVLLDTWRQKQEQKKYAEKLRYTNELRDYHRRREVWMARELRERRRARQIEEEEYGESSSFSLMESEHTSENSSIDDPDSEQATIDRLELEEIWQQEYPEPVLFTAWEDFETAKERILRGFEETYENDSKKLQSTRRALEDESIPWIEVDAQRTTREVLLRTMKILEPYVSRNVSIIERTYTIDLDTAEGLLDCGYYFLSSFGRWCPGQLYEKKNPMQTFLPLEAQQEIFPVLHRQYVYFLGGREALSAFSENPLKYLEQDSCAPLIPPRISIIGPPKCGKTTLAQRFAEKYGMKIITRGTAVRRALKNLSWTKSARLAESRLRSGNIVPEESIVRTVEMYSMDPRSIAQGILFDGFPSNRTENERLTLLGLQPMIVLDLKANLDFCLECLSNDDDAIKRPPNFSPKFLTHRYENWTIDREVFRDWLKKFSQNVIEIDATRSKWWVWTRADQAVRDRIFDVALYYRESDYDKAHRLESMCISPYEFRRRQSEYESFCPLCLFHENIAKTSGPPPDGRGMVQFREHFYWICPRHMDDFVKNPLRHLPPINTATLPKERPRILKETVDVEHSCWAKRLRAGGFCLVTYVEKLPARRLVPGKSNLAAIYEDKVYLFCSVECRDKFLAEWAKYADVDVNFPRTLAPIDIKNLPDLGFLEQTVADLIIRAANQVGVLRPKIPGLSPSVTASIYCGVYLKIHNPNPGLKEVEIYEAASKRIAAHDQILRVATRTMKKRLNPYVTVPRYPDGKPIERISKISQVSSRSRSTNFIKFRRTSPTQTLVSPDDEPEYER